jgi:hypothetical protein
MAKAKKKAATKPIARSQPPRKEKSMATKKKSGGRRGAASGGFGNLGAALLGSSTGALAGAFLRALKVKPVNAAIGTGLVGGIGAVTTQGKARWFCAGLATSGASALITDQATTRMVAAGINPSPVVNGIPAANGLPSGMRVRQLASGAGDIAEIDEARIIDAFAEAQRELADAA